MRYRKQYRLHTTITTVLIGVVFLVIGVVTYHSFKELEKKAQDALEWERVPCLILESGVGIHESNDDKGNAYSFDVLYSYQFKGRSYRCADFSLERTAGKPYGSQEENLALVDMYPVGSETYCYVNPVSPFEAVLYIKINRKGLWAALLFIGLGGLFILGAIIFFIYERYRSR